MNYYAYDEGGRFVAVVTAKDEEEAVEHAKRINPYAESAVPGADQANKFARFVG